MSLFEVSPQEWAAIGKGLALGMAAGLGPSPHTLFLCAISVQSGIAFGIAAAVSGFVVDSSFAVLAYSSVLGGAIPFPAWAAQLLLLAHSLYLLQRLHSARKSGPNQATTEKITRGLALTLSISLGIQLLNPNPWIFWFGQSAAGDHTSFGVFASVFVIAILAAKLFWILVARSLSVARFRNLGFLFPLIQIVQVARELCVAHP